MFLASFGQGMLVPTLPLFVRDLGVNFTMVTLAVAMAGLGTLVWNVPSGLMLARSSERRVQIVGMFVMAAAVLLLALSPPYPLVILLRLVAGVGMAMWSLSRMTLLLRLVPGHQRGRAMSLFGGINRIGTFASPALGGVIAEQFGFGPMFLVAGLFIAVGILPTILFAEVHADRPVQLTRRPPSLVQIGRVFRTHARDLATAGPGQLFAQTVRSGRQIVIPLYAAFELGLDPAQIGFAVSASAAVDMTLFPLAGFVMDRFGRKFTSVPAFALLGIAMALMPLARDFTGLIAVAMLVGLANGIGSGAMLTLGTDLAPKERPSEFLGVWRLIGDTGQTGGPLVVGAVADAIGLALAPFFLAGVGGAAALTFAFLVPETLRRHRAAPRTPP